MVLSVYLFSRESRDAAWGINYSEYAPGSCGVAASLGAAVQGSPLRGLVRFTFDCYQLFIKQNIMEEKR